MTTFPPLAAWSDHSTIYRREWVKKEAYIWEELALVDAYYVKLTINVADLFESLGTQGLHSLPIGEGFSKNDMRTGWINTPTCVKTILTCHEWLLSLMSSECQR